MAAANPRTADEGELGTMNPPALIPNPIANMTIIYDSDEENEKEEEVDEFNSCLHAGKGKPIVWFCIIVWLCIWGANVKVEYIRSFFFFAYSSLTTLTVITFCSLQYYLNR